MYKKLGGRYLWNEMKNVFINIEAKNFFRGKLVQGLGLGSARRRWCFEPHLFHILSTLNCLTDLNEFRESRCNSYWYRLFSKTAKLLTFTVMII